MSQLSQFFKNAKQFFKNVPFLLDYYRVARHSTVILSAGMPRSGSTWLFNAARLLLRTTVPADSLSSGWIGDWTTLPKRRWQLFKIHEYQPWLARHAHLILYSYRDIRDALASLRRKFGEEPTMARARILLNSDRRWRQRAAFSLRYESMMADPREAVAELARTLRVSCLDCDSTVRQLEELGDRSADLAGSAPDQETQLHPGHITDGRHGSWEGWLKPALVRQIEAEFGWWLRDNGYAGTEAVIQQPRA